MVYVFQALSHNRLLKPGDKIAIGTPIFTPYTQIPNVMNYGLVSIDVSNSEENNWDIDEEELRKLEKPEVKAFFLVNPSNPASHALSENTLKALCEVVEKNPDLIDIDRLMSEQYGEDFAEYICDSMTEIDFLNDLAQKKGVVVMYGPGFEAPDGTIRISLANLNKDDYVEIAERILELLDEYYEEYEAEEQEAA